ncbi:MAG: dihydroorotate dehydrogenase electron transfer subunit, partial [Dehalococcoidales bacterium]|nr:dihydroorotate dehydrogenase electron transfer subunit [Dehalococcoidales bacterium]
MKQALSPIISNTEVLRGAHLIWLECPDIASEAKAGQYLMVRCGEGTLLRRPLSLHRIDRKDGRIALLFNSVGKGTKWLAEQKEGDTLDIMGPLGNGFALPNKGEGILLIAGGMGIAPICCLGEEARRQDILPDSMLYGSASDFLSEEERKLIFPKTLIPSECLIRITEDGTLSQQGRVTDIIKHHLKETTKHIFACGPLPMYRTMSQMQELKGKSVQVSLELRMGCGVGVCYGCTVHTRHGLKQVCKDGPVFDLNDITN